MDELHGWRNMCVPEMRSQADGIAEEDITSYRSNASKMLNEIETYLSGDGWDMLELEEQGNIMYSITRLYGVDEFTSTDIRDRLDRKPDQLACADVRYIPAHRPSGYCSVSAPKSHSKPLLKPTPFNQPCQHESPRPSRWRRRCAPRLPRYSSSII